VEKIIIKNFLDINTELSLSRVNIFIGKKATGKSIILKLIYFCKTSFNMLEENISDSEGYRELNKKLIEQFKMIFFEKSLINSSFLVEYINGKFSLKLSKEKGKKISINFSEYTKKSLTSIRRQVKNNYKKQSMQKEKLSNTFRLQLETQQMIATDFLIKSNSDNITYSQFFFPAGRSFFASIEANIFDFISSNKTIDHLLAKFGSYLSRCRFMLNFEDSDRSKFNRKIKHIIKGKYLERNGVEYLISNNKEIPIKYCSSGQQELLPLLMLVDFLDKNSSTLYIEEPEGHIDPNSQKELLEFILKESNKKQLFISTHSPYIITTLNNQLIKHDVMMKFQENNIDIPKDVNFDTCIDKNEVQAYSVEENTTVSIISEEDGLIESSKIDYVSNLIFEELDKLLELEEEMSYD
jgi:predicted ATPase